MNTNEDIHRLVSDYYTAKLVEHGCTPRGVDWNGAESQRIRFAQLAKVIPSEPFTLLDVGCGYAAFFDFLTESFSEFHYMGVDISPAMIDAAKSRIRDSRAAFETAISEAPVSDYAVSSGIFNVRMNESDERWSTYVFETLELMNRKSAKGWAANFLTSYSDRDRMRSDLFYADPCKLFDWAKRNVSRHVALLHDYELYEFTLIVRK